MSTTASDVPKRSQQTSILSFMTSPLAELNQMKPLATSTPMVPNTTPKSTINRKRKLANVVEEDRTQTILDAGQKKIGLTGCEECGMFYNVDIQKDVKTHRDYHHRFEKNKWFEIDKRSSNVWFKKLFNKPITGQVPGTVFRLQSDEKSSLRNRVESIIKECIDPQIGIAEDVPAFSPDKKQEAFVFIADATQSRGVFFGACVLVEKALSCKLMPDRKVFHATNADRCFLAVERLWVHPSLRNQHVATNLLNAVREILSPSGFTFQKTRIAFCDPTSGCIEFAMKYLDGKKKNQWIVHDPEDSYGPPVNPPAPKRVAAPLVNKNIKVENPDKKPIKRETGDSKPSTSTSHSQRHQQPQTSGKAFPKRRRVIDPNMKAPTVTISDEEKPAEVTMERYDD